MFSLTRKEFEMMMRCNDAIDHMVDHGTWERIDGKLVFVIPEDAADRILVLIDDAQEIDDE